MYCTEDETLCRYSSESQTNMINNKKSLLFGVAISFYSLIIVPKQNSPAEKPRETTVDAVEIIPAKLHMHTASIAPVEIIRTSSRRMVDKTVDFYF